VVRADGDRRLHAGHARHAQIEQRHVGQILAVHLHRLLSVGGFRHYGHVGLHVDDGGHADACHQVIFGH
jgi:hypothetical protein